jgi:mannose-6-phosphate isomerase
VNVLYPLKFIPVYKDYIWGERSLERFGRALPQDRIAESWKISCHPGGISIISNGIFMGL